MENNKVQFLVVHHTGPLENSPGADTSSQTVQDINNWHKIRGFPISSLGYYVGYHYVITKEGEVTQCRQDDEIGAHTIGYNDKSIGIVLTGNFDYFHPTWGQTYALKSLLTQKIKQYGLLASKVAPHRAFAQKSCYGRNLTDSWASDLVRQSLNDELSLLQRLLIHLKELYRLMTYSKMVVGQGIDDKECQGFIK